MDFIRDWLEAKMHLSRFLKQVKSDTGVATVVPCTPPAGREPGLLKGKVTIKPGFDDFPEGFDAFE